MFQAQIPGAFPGDKEQFNIATVAYDYMEFARKYHERYLIKGNKSDLDNAIENYVDAIKLNPDIPEPYYRLASLLWDKGEINLAGAIEQCRSAIRLSPENPNPRIYVAHFLEMAKKYDEAEKQFKKAIKLNPVKAARSRLSLASMYWAKMNDSDINVKDISKAFYYMLSGSLSIAFDYPSLKMLYKNVYRNASFHLFNIAGKVLEKIKNYSMAVKTYDAAAGVIGHGDIFYKKIGDINLIEDEIETARISYLKALDVAPCDKELLRKVAKLTQTYFEEDVNTSIDCYTKLLQSEENNADTYYELGHLYLKKEDFISSINAFNLALEKDFQNPFYHNALAYALVKAEQYQEAAEHYRFAIESNPDDEWTSIVCQALASLYYSVFDDIDGALELLKQALIFDSRNDDAFLDIGNIYFETEDTDSAVKAYCEAIKLNPQSYKAYDKCAMALWRKNYIEEAIIAYNKALAINPECASSYNNLGVIYLDGVRNLKEAKKLFERAVSLNKNYVTAYYNLGRVMEETGKKVEAAKYYQQALELNKVKVELPEEEIKLRLFGLFEV